MPSGVPSRDNTVTKREPYSAEIQQRPGRRTLWARGQASGRAHVRAHGRARVRARGRGQRVDALPRNNRGNRGSAARSTPVRRVPELGTAGGALACIRRRLPVQAPPAPRLAHIPVITRKEHLDRKFRLRPSGLAAKTRTGRFDEFRLLLGLRAEGISSPGSRQAGQRPAGRDRGRRASTHTGEAEPSARSPQSSAEQGSGPRTPDIERRITQGQGGL
jgi:hypothetical protein